MRMSDRGVRSCLLVAVAFLSAAGAPVAAAQGLFDSLRSTVEREAKRRADEALRKPAARPPSASPPATAARSDAIAATVDPATGALHLAERRVPDDPRYLDVGLRRLAPARPVVLAAPGEVRPPRWRGTPGAPPAAPGAATEFPSDGPCRWLPVIDAFPQLPVGVGETRAESAAVRAELRRVHAFLAADPVINPPVGVCPLFSNAGIQQVLSGGWALPGSALVGYWPAEWVSRRGQRIVTDGELNHLLLYTNRLPTADLVNARLQLEDHEGGMWSQGPVTHTMQGFPVLNSATLFITLHDRPLTRSTRIDRLLRWQVAQVDAALPRQRSYAEGQALRLAEMQSAEQAARDEETIAQRARWSTGGDLAKARASFTAERDAELATLRAAADTTRPEHPVHLMLSQRADALQRLAAFEGTAAAAPGCLTRAVKGTAIPDVVTTDHPQCVHPIEEANPDYWDRSLPRTRLQLFAIGRMPLQPAEAIVTTREKWDVGNANLVYGIDWQRFRSTVLAAP